MLSLLTISLGTTLHVAAGLQVRWSGSDALLTFRCFVQVALFKRIAFNVTAVASSCAIWVVWKFKWNLIKLESKKLSKFLTFVVATFICVSLRHTRPCVAQIWAAFASQRDTISVFLTFWRTNSHLRIRWAIWTQSDCNRNYRKNNKNLKKFHLNFWCGDVNGKNSTESQFVDLC